MKGARRPSGVTGSGGLACSVRLEIMTSGAAKPGHAAPGAARLLHTRGLTPLRACVAAQPSCGATICQFRLPLRACRCASIRLSMLGVNARTHARVAYSTPSAQPAAPAGTLIMEARKCGYQSCMPWPVSSLSTVMQTACHSLPLRVAQGQKLLGCTHYMRALNCPVQLLSAKQQKHTPSATYVAPLNSCTSNWWLTSKTSQCAFAGWPAWYPMPYVPSSKALPHLAADRMSRRKRRA